MIRTMTGILVCLLVGLMLVQVQARIGVDENALTQEERLLVRNRRRKRGERGGRGGRAPKNEMDPTNPVVQSRADDDMFSLPNRMSARTPSVCAVSNKDALDKCTGRNECQEGEDESTHDCFNGCLIGQKECFNGLECLHGVRCYKEKKHYWP
eukprot:scaffold36374_cov58-Attheya_sp.AAC.10